MGQNIPTREEVRIQIAEHLGKAFDESSLVSHSDFSRIVSLAKIRRWPLKPHAGPSWCSGERLRDLLDQLALRR